MFLNSGLSGDQRVFKEARTLADAGYEVTIICNQEPSAATAAWEGIGIVSIPRRPALFSPGRFTLEWIRTALRLKPDVIHAHDLNTLGRAWLTARLTGSKLIYDSHDYYPRTQFVLRMPRWRQWYYQRKEGFLNRRCDLVIHVVPDLCRMAADEFRIPAPALITNFPMGEAPRRSRVLHEMFGLSPGTRIVIYEGVVALERGLENLVLSARFLRSDVAIVILGRGYLKERLKKLAAEIRVADRVKFVEKIELENFPKYCAASDVGIAIYENEGLTWECGWSTKTFDYMRAGIPTLISGSRASERMVVENDAGIVVKDISPESIARHIEELLDDRKRYRRFQKNAVRAWRENFNWETEGKKLLALYESLLAD